MDFTGGADIYDGLGEKLAGLDIGILGEYFCVKLWQFSLWEQLLLVVFYSQTATTDNLSTMSDQPLSRDMAILSFVLMDNAYYTPITLHYNH